jgi:RNase P/RNase MRP subunit p30
MHEQVALQFYHKDNAQFQGRWSRLKRLDYSDGRLSLQMNDQDLESHFSHPIINDESSSWRNIEIYRKKCIKSDSP